MTSWFSRLQIRGKLIVLMLATSAVVLALASAGTLYFQSEGVREDAENDLLVQAQLIIDSADAPLTFDDQPGLEKALEALRTNTNIRTACLYGQSDGPPATYRQPGALPCPEERPPDGVYYETNRIVVTKSDYEGTKRVATMHIRSDLGALERRVRTQVFVILGVMLIALAVAVVMSARLQRIVADPIVDLSRTASAIASGGDYSVRATRRTQDEIGMLVDAFNGMLQTIQSRDADLSRANEDLRREVIERRRAEQERAELLVREREANRLKDEFLATLSHELRTPLNAILGWTKLLRGGALPADALDRALEKVERNAQVQTRLVEDLLEVSRITTGKLRLESKEYDLAAAAVRAADSIRPAAEARGIQLTYELAQPTLPTTGDPDRIQQVIWNLLSNAVKFTPAGGTVRLTLRRAGDRDEIVIADTGSGIEPEFLPHVFDTFRQADASATRAHGGLGLGLAIVRNLVELHGGTVGAESPGRDRGATFTVRLPVRLPVERTEERHTPIVVPQGTLSGRTVLAVDDDNDTRELIQSILESAGARVFAASSVDEALLRLEHERPDALVTDIGMPGRDGYALLQDVRTLLGARSPRVAVALSAYASEQDRQRSAAAGFQRHIAKPVDPAALVEILRQLLDAAASDPSPVP
jgi:signal transduction histidine kinase/ActR/RegA family two-component response regulator